MNDQIATASARYLASIGYIDAAPARAKLCELTDAGVILERLAAGIGTTSAILSNIRRGKSKFVNPDVASAINAIEVGVAVERYSKKPEPVDGIQLERILAGFDITLASHQKPSYARALHDHGWHKTRIARQLRMSGTAINKVLQAA